MAISDLTAIKVKEFLADLPCSNKHKSNILVPLRQMYDDISKILQELKGQEKNLIQCAFWTGLRTSELIALRWQDVDFDKNCIHVRIAKVRGQLKDTKTKSGKRDVILQPQAREALLSQTIFTGKQNNTVFYDSRTNQPWKSDQAIRKIVWIPTLKRANVKYRNPYQTRHTFASKLLSRGENPMFVAQQMGHKDWSMIIKVYGRWIPQPK